MSDHLPSPVQFKSKTVTCPACGGTSLYAPENRYRPFCSERCKNHDLGAWASEQFRVPTDPPLDSSPDESENWRH